MWKQGLLQEVVKGGGGGGVAVEVRMAAGEGD